MYSDFCTNYDKIQDVITELKMQNPDVNVDDLTIAFNAIKEYVDALYEENKQLRRCLTV